MEKINILNTKNYYRTYYVDDNKRPMIFICAGGGYQYTSPREEEPIMKIFFEKGYHVCIVNYREDNSFYPAPGMNVAYALNKMKNDDKVTKIIGIGFSMILKNRAASSVEKQRTSFLVTFLCCLCRTLQGLESIIPSATAEERREERIIFNVRTLSSE